MWKCDCGKNNQSSNPDDHTRLLVNRWVKLSLNFELLVYRVMKFLLGQRLFNNNIFSTTRIFPYPRNNHQGKLTMDLFCPSFIFFSIPSNLALVLSWCIVMLYTSLSCTPFYQHPGRRIFPLGPSSVSPQPSTSTYPPALDSEHCPVHAGTATVLDPVS